MKNIFFSAFLFLSFVSSAQTIAAGGVHSLVVCNNNTVWGWGYNVQGQLGNGTNTYNNVPVPVGSLTGIIAIAGGANHSLALKNDGTVWACGYNLYGQLGNGANIDSNVPVQVSYLSGVVAIAAGGWFSLALKNDGSVWAWGYNLDGELGNGTNTNSNIPVNVSSLTGITAIAAGGYGHSLALKNDGSVWAWGLNSYGQLGNGTNTNSNIPIIVSSLTGIIAISGGYGHSLAKKNDNTVWAWGWNADSELGNGTNINSNVPVQAIGLCQYQTAVNETTETFLASVFPNPSSGIFTVDLKNKTFETKICVYDLLGNCLWNKNCRNDTSPKIDLSCQPKGIYFMEIVSGGARAVKKIVLE